MAKEKMNGKCKWVSYLLDQEIQPATVQKQMRHKRFDATQRYNRGETARALVGAY